MVNVIGMIRGSTGDAEVEDVDCRELFGRRWNSIASSTSDWQKARNRESLDDSRWSSVQFLNLHRPGTRLSRKHCCFFWCAKMRQIHSPGDSAIYGPFVSVDGEKTPAFCVLSFQKSIGNSRPLFDIHRETFGKRPPSDF